MDERGERRADIRAIFKGQSDRAYLFGKLEKLAHAVMLLTSRSDRDAFSLIERLELSVLDSVREAAALAVHADHSPLSSILLELVSLLRLGATAGLISEANARVLVDEYLKILSRLAAPSVQGIVLSQDELLAEPSTNDQSQPSRPLLPSSIDDLFGAEDPSVARARAPQRPRAIGRAGKGGSPSGTPPQAARPKALAGGVSDRSQRILAIVKAKGIVSIGDVSAVVTDCSEKTIQRELLALVEQGVLKKEGERRWSTYRLA
jgi:hypothetical protein